MECAFTLGLAPGMRYSAERLTPQKCEIYCAGQRFESGVKRSNCYNAIRIAVAHTTPHIGLSREPLLVSL